MCLLLIAESGSNLQLVKIEAKIPFLRLLSHESLLSHLMNCTDYFINIQLISFISSCFEQRDKLVTMATSEWLKIRNGCNLF